MFTVIFHPRFRRLLLIRPYIKKCTHGLLIPHQVQKFLLRQNIITVKHSKSLQSADIGYLCHSKHLVLAHLSCLVADRHLLTRQKEVNPFAVIRPESGHDHIIPCLKLLPVELSLRILKLFHYHLSDTVYPSVHLPALSPCIGRLGTGVLRPSLLRPGILEDPLFQEGIVLFADNRFNILHIDVSSLLDSLKPF